MPRITVGRAPHVSPNDKNRHSDYHITVSTNYKPTSPNETNELIEALANATEDVFGTDKNLARIVHFNNPRHYWDEKYIQDVDMKHAPEIGAMPKGSRVHTHIVLRIKHTSNISIQNAAPIIKKLYFESGYLDPFPIANLYVNIKLLRNDKEALRKYLGKQHHPPAKPEDITNDTDEGTESP
jgi:hypothetical protein